MDINIDLGSVFGLEEFSGNDPWCSEALTLEIECWRLASTGEMEFSLAASAVWQSLYGGVEDKTRRNLLLCSLEANGVSLARQLNMEVPAFLAAARCMAGEGKPSVGDWKALESIVAYICASIGAWTSAHAELRSKRVLYALMLAKYFDRLDMGHLATIVTGTIELDTVVGSERGLIHFYEANRFWSLGLFGQCLVELKSAILDGSSGFGLINIKAMLAYFSVASRGGNLGELNGSASFVRGFPKQYSGLRLFISAFDEMFANSSIMNSSIRPYDLGRGLDAVAAHENYTPDVMLWCTGWCSMRDGHFGGALAIFSRLLAYSRGQETGSLFFELMALEGMAHAEASLGHHREACISMQKAFRLNEFVDIWSDARFVANTLSFAEWSVLCMYPPAVETILNSRRQIETRALASPGIVNRLFEAEADLRFYQGEYRRASAVYMVTREFGESDADSNSIDSTIELGLKEIEARLAAGMFESADAMESALSDLDLPSSLSAPSKARLARLEVESRLLYATSADEVQAALEEFMDQALDSTLPIAGCILSRMRMASRMYELDCPKRANELLENLEGYDLDRNFLQRLSALRHMYLGRHYTHEFHFSKASTEFESAAAMSLGLVSEDGPNAHLMRLESARCEVLAGNFTSGVEKYRNLVSAPSLDSVIEPPMIVDAKIELARVLQQTGQHSDAAVAFKDALDSLTIEAFDDDGRRIETLISYAWNLELSGNTSLAATSYENAISLSERNTDGLSDTVLHALQHRLRCCSAGPASGSSVSTDRPDGMTREELDSKR